MSKGEDKLDWQSSLRHVSASLNLSCGSVIRIVTDVLDMQRVSARLVPRLLSGTEKELDYQVREI